MVNATMARSAYYQLRLSQDEKEQAFSVIRDQGISPAQAFRLFLKQVVDTRSIPFPIQASAHCPLGLSHVPNAKTIAAMKELDDRKDLKSYNTIEDLFADLND
jgi:addiction module RelB/DinJ family antitoxin